MSGVVWRPTLGHMTQRRRPVLESKSTNNVFIYNSDHGATGLVAMTSGDGLYALDLNTALKHMRDTKLYDGRRNTEA